MALPGRGNPVAAAMEVRAVSLLDFIKVHVASPLQLFVAGMGVCPKCHKKTLVHRHDDDSYVWMQCTKCHNVYMLGRATDS